jgi:hypothetical protein
LIKTLLQQKKPSIKQGKRDLVLMTREASALILVLLVSFPFLIPLLVEAQPEPPDVDTLGPVVFCDQSGGVVILSPRNSTNYVNQMQLVFAVEANGMFGQFGNVGVSLDGGVINSVTDFIDKSVVQSGPDWYWYRTTVLASVMLPTLSEGTHSVTVYYGWQYLGIPENPSLQRYEVFAHATVDFMVVNSDATNVSTAVSDITSCTKPEISIISPSNMSFNTNSLPLNITVGHINPLATEASAYYSLDGKGNITLSSGQESRIENAEKIVTPYNLEIGNLSDGLHNLTVYAKITYWHYGLSSASTSVQFTIDTSPPIISELSISNKTYNLQNITLSFNVNENTSWAAYNLDNQGNTTIQGNTTLTGLSDGSHSIVVYANDTLGNMGKSDTVFFTVNIPTAENFIPAIVLSGMIVIVVAVGLLVYFKKRKH